MLEMFSEKPIRPSLKSTYYFSLFQEIRKSKGCSYKKERKENVRNVLKETHLSNNINHLPFRPIPRDPEVQKYPRTIPTKKKKKRTLGMFSEKSTCPFT